MPAARRAGMASIALSQVLGLGLLTGSLARWRMLPPMGPVTAMKLTAFIALTFMSAWAWLAALASLALAGPIPTPLALVVLVLGPALMALAFFRPLVRVFGHDIRFPTLPAMVQVLWWTALDLGFAAAALYFLLPPGAEVPLATVLPVYLLALGAALIIGSPGGLGPFELTLLTFLPMLSQSDLLAAMAGFRIVYYALPASLGLLALARAPRDSRDLSQPLPPVPHHSVPPLRRAEANLVALNGGSVVGSSMSLIAVAPLPQTLVMLLDPIKGAPPLTALHDEARRKNRFPLIYKCTMRTACQVRAKGWAVQRLGAEAVIDPRTYDIDTPARSGLRRKLRKADKAGLTTKALRPLPLADMARINADWAARKGHERGFSMSRFCETSLRNQRVYGAYRDGVLLAFASFHRSEHQLCLDLMRSAKDTPDGTMHALLHRAIQDAAIAGLPQVSLAAIGPDHSPRWMTRFADTQGLRQFKSGFAPRWQPLYAAAPNRAALALGLADVARAITCPPSANRTIPHEDDEKPAFAPPHSA